MTLTSLLASATSVINAMVGWVGSVISAIFSDGGSWSSIAPFLFIGLGITLILTSVGVVRSFIAGRSM